MKKTLCVILTLFMLFSLTACKDEDLPQITEYIPNTQAEVVVAYIYGGNANIVTRQPEDVELKKITLVCIFFDTEGKRIGEQKMVDCTIGDEGDVVLWQTGCPENAAYVESIVYATTDAAGNTLKAERIDLWESSASASFNPETHLDDLVIKLSANAALATSNPYATLGAISWQGLDILVEIQPLSEDVKSVYLFALWFDKDGVPIETGTCTYCYNGEPMLAHVSSTEVHNFIFEAPENAHQAKLIVQSVDFNDGTQWLNPYCYEWIVLNCTSAE